MKIRQILEFIIWSTVICFVFFTQYKSFGGFYNNVDYYTQAVRFKTFLVEHTWTESLFMQSNYPFGEMLNGNRAVDLIWLVCSLFFNDYTDIVLRTFLTGVASTVACSLLLLFIFILGTGKVLSCWSRAIAIILLLIQKQAYPDFAFATPELFLLIPTLLLIVSWWNYDTVKGQIPIVLMGFSCALMCWMNTQGLLFVHILLLALMICWFMGRISSGDLVIFFGVFAVFMALFWGVNPPADGYKAVVLTRLSLYHVIMAWVFFVIVNVFKFLPLHNAIRKMSTFLSFVPVAALIMYLILKQQLHEILDMYNDTTMKTLLDKRVHIVYRFEELLYIYPVLASAIGVYLLLFFRYRGKVIVPLFILMTSSIAQYFNLSSVSLTAAVAMVVVSLFFQKIYERTQKLSFLFVLVSMLMVGVEYGALQSMTLPEKNYGIKTVTAELASDVGSLLYYRQGTVLSDSIYGPLILWYTNHNVVAMPYRSSKEGIIDADKIWKSESLKEVWQILNARKIDYIFLPADYDEKYFASPKENAKKFYARILTGQNLPKWIKPLKHKDNPKIHVYKVMRNTSEEARANVARREAEKLAAEREAAKQVTDNFDALLLP